MIGFDFPIGLSAGYGRSTGLAGFRACLDAFGRGDWLRWYEVVDDRDDLSIHRPFYPLRPGGRRQDHLLTALGVASMDDLRRVCEMPTGVRGAASPMFWTLGGNQVGKAAISGWRSFVIPALRRPGVALWPFDGSVFELLNRAALTIAETYPADAYRQIGIRFGPGMSKRRQSDRASFAPRLLAWAVERDHTLAPELKDEISEGFGHRPEGEDRFDAFVGLCGMLEVIGGHRADGAPDDPDIGRWEGWIFGQSNDHLARSPPIGSPTGVAAEGARSDEAALIARYFAPLAGPGAEKLRDDAASLTPSPGHDLVLTTDAIVAGVHYFPDDPPGSIARKALGVNLSDLAAKGAAPRGFLLTLALPDDWTESWLARFSDGLRDASAALGCPLLGGDTVRSAGPALISVTAIGELSPGSMVRRQGARPGDRLCVTGTIGDSALGLALLRAPGGELARRIAPEASEVLIDRYRHPQPRLPLAPILRAHARAAMDVSDGLVGDLAKMLGEGTTARIAIADVPLSEAARSALAIDRSALDAVLTGGDDYEILCAVPPDALDRFLAEAASVGVAVAPIGSVEAGEGPAVFVDADEREHVFRSASFSHF